MKKSVCLFGLSGLLLAFAACNDNSNTVDKPWKEANEKAYSEIRQKSDYKELKTATGPSGVFYTIIKEGAGTVHPLQTATVKVLYKGEYYDDTFFNKGTYLVNSSGKLVEPDEKVPVAFSVNETVRGRGFSFALQQMVVGDKWRICIPYWLGYGYAGYTDSYGSTLVKGYSTLFYEVELVDITQYP